jgi:hypothetical protein
MNERMRENKVEYSADRLCISLAKQIFGYKGSAVETVERWEVEQAEKS